MTTIPFAHIPDNFRAPLFYAEVDPSLANTGTENQRALIIGQITGSGAAPANVPLLSRGSADAKVQGGAGSMLALMTAAWRKNDSVGEVWYLPLADAGGAVAAVGSIKFTHVATAAGALYVYIGATQLSDRLVMPVTSAQTLQQLATALAALINANTDLPVTAAIDGGDNTMVDITAKNAGEAGNQIDIYINYQGIAGGETLPTALTITVVQPTGGTTNPVLTTALANCQDVAFDFIVMPYTDATSLNALKSFLDDNTGRWSFSNQVFGHALFSYTDTLANLVTFGTGRNDQHASNVGFFDTPTPGWIRAAAFFAAAAVSLRADPGRPLQTLAVAGVLPPPLVSRFALTDRNTLLFDGVSTYTVDSDGTVRIENLITTYRTNAFAQPDNSYLQIETMYLLMAILRRLKTIVTTKFGRMKLAPDGTRFAAGASIVTPGIVRATLISEYRIMEREGLVTNADAFAKGLIVQPNANNPSRLDVLWDGTLIGGLRIFALLAQFRNS